MALAYVDARAIQDRLDDVLGVACCRMTMNAARTARSCAGCGSAWARVDHQGRCRRPSEQSDGATGSSGFLRRSETGGGQVRHVSLSRLPRSGSITTRRNANPGTQPTLPASRSGPREPKLAARATGNAEGQDPFQDVGDRGGVSPGTACRSTTPRLVPGRCATRASWSSTSPRRCAGRDNADLAMYARPSRWRTRRRGSSRASRASAGGVKGRSRKRCAPCAPCALPLPNDDKTMSGFAKTQA